VYVWLKNNAHEFGFCRSVQKQPEVWSYTSAGCKHVDKATNKPIIMGGAQIQE